MGHYRVTENSVQRRLAAILAADVVGYSRLMSQDEAGTLAAVRKLRTEVIEPKIGTHHGRLFKTMGDGFLVEFPSVVNAVACAVDIQTAMSMWSTVSLEERRIQLRIGVNLGDVVVDNSDVFGDGVNIAARLEGISPPGGVVLSGVAFEQIGNRLNFEFHDIGEHILKNIDRPVRAFLYSVEPVGTSSLRPQPLKLPTKPSIAVLPFKNLSNGARQDYFADGIVEDIITGLSRIKWLFVIARNSTFVYQGKPLDVRDVGRALGVRYILEGSVRKVESRLRVTTQLVEAESRAHLWAEKYDGAIEDVFSFQDSITERVVGIVEPSVRKSEIERSRQKRPDSLDAYDLFLRAMPHLQARMPDEGRKAIPLLEEALHISPDYHAARAYLAWCYEWCFTRGGLQEKDRSTAISHARAALASDTDDAAALAIAGWVVIVLTKEHGIALDAIKRALAINPSCATAHYFAALVKSFAGRTSTAFEHADQALRLSPFDPSAFEAHLAKGMASIGEDSFEEAAAHFSAGERVNPRHSLFPFFRAIALALAGRAEEGRASVERGLQLEPGFRIRIFTEFGMNALLAEKFIAGARQLGLQE